MSIAVIFYNFAKKENSTERPTGAGASYNVVLKDDCSIERPAIELNARPTSFYNYAYISDFSRYYFVSDWSYFRGTWTASLTVDVLATYKNEIGASTVYVLRSSYTFDKEVKDTLYPLKSNVNKQVESGTLYSWASGMSQGTYIAYVNNGHFDSENAYGSLNFMTFTPTNFTHLLEAIYPSSPQTWQDITNSSYAYNIIGGALINPIDYITKVLWIPLSVGSGSYETWFGYYKALDSNSNAISHGILSSFTTTQTVSLTIPKRGDVNRGSWADAEPFGQYYLYYAPFGKIPLDSSLLMDASTLDCTAQLDLMTGDLKLTVRTVGDYGSFKDVVWEGMSNVGVNIPVDKAKSEGIKTFEALTGAASTIFDMSTGNFQGAFNDLMNTVGTVLQSPPKGSPTSSGLLSISDTIYLYHEYLDFVDEDNANKGRPLCQMQQISGIPGFILTNDGDVDMPGTSNEKTMVKNYLERGFYYE